MAMDGNGNVSALVDATDRTVAAEYEYAPVSPVREWQWRDFRMLR